MKLNEIRNCCFFTAAALLSVLTSSGQGNLVINGGFAHNASGWTMTNVDVSEGGGYDISIGNPPGSVFLFETKAPADSNWHSFSFDYTAASSSVLLSLSAEINGTDDSYFIDNIAMHAIPEPSIVSFMLLGSGVLIFVRRNKGHFHL